MISFNVTTATTSSSFASQNTSSRTTSNTITSSSQQSATFTGGSLLSGICTSTRFTSIVTAGTVIEFPTVGCASDNLGCCPKNLSLLTSCPADYTTTSWACCPS